MSSTNHLTIDDPDLVTTVTMNLQKGGSGKTTTLMMVGYTLARMGLRVLLIDADQNCGITQFMALSDPDLDVPTIADILTPDCADGSAAEVIIDAPDEWQPNPDLPWDRNGALREGGGVSVICGSPEAYRSVRDHADGETWLGRSLVGVARQFDLVLIDTHPGDAEETTMAMRASAWIVGAFKPGFADWLSDYAEFIAAFTEGAEHPMRYLGAICTAYRATHTVAHGRPLREAYERQQTEEPAYWTLDRDRIDTPVGPMHYGSIWPQVIPDSAEIELSQALGAPIACEPPYLHLSALYAQLGIRLLALIKSPALAGVVETLERCPVDGVLPLYRDDEPPRIGRGGLR